MINIAGFKKKYQIIGDTNTIHITYLSIFIYFNLYVENSKSLDTVTRLLIISSFFFFRHLAFFLFFFIVLFLIWISTFA
jgi:hypothetical protein